MTTALLPRCGRRTLVALYLVALLLMMSCGRDVTSTLEASTPNDVIVVGKPTEPGDDRRGEVLVRPPVVASRDDLLDETRIVPDDVMVDSADPNQLRILFTAGGAPCTGARLSVDAGPATVGIALYVGTPPEHADTRCDASARVQEIHGTLDRPLGSRELMWGID